MAWRPEPQRRLTVLPVSYTHLDVYKRQTLQAAQGTESTSIVNFENGKIAGAIRNYISPEMGAIYQKYTQEPLRVSYTHLDVYKRQGQSRRRRTL